MKRRGSGSRRAGARGCIIVCLLVSVLATRSVVSAGSPISFAAPRFYPTPPGGIAIIPELVLPLSIATADLNGDGKADLATANLSASVSVLLGSGDGSFQPRVDYPTANYAFTVVVADVNGDTKPDLVVGSANSNAASILLGNGNGTFRPHIEINTGMTAVTVEVGDFNNDRKLDLAVTNWGNATVSIVPGNGDGTFQAPIASPLGSQGGTYGRFATSDFDGDGSLDIAVANSQAATLTVLLGKGDGTFQPPRVMHLAPPAYPQFVIARDLDGDGSVDLVVGSGRMDDNSLRVLIGNGNGTFRAPVSYQTGTDADAFAILDANEDGKPDLAVVGGTDIAILTNNGDGTFALANSLAVGGFVSGITALDANGDGRPDIAGFGGGVSVSLNTTPLNTAPSVRVNPLQVTGVPSPAPPYRPSSAPSILPPPRSSGTASTSLGDASSTPMPAPHPLPSRR